MRIKKYDVDYFRRHLMQTAALGLGTGVLMPIEKLFASQGDDIRKVYPDELLSIEIQSKGKIKPGDVIDKSNVESVKHLLDPGIYEQISGPEGRTIYIKAPETNPRNLTTASYYDATSADIKNGHTAHLDANKNVVDEKGNKWQGGLPFPSPKTAEEVWMNMGLNIGREDVACYVIDQTDLDPAGKQQYHYNFQWVEMNTMARTARTPYKNLTDELRRQSVYFAANPDVRGTTFLSIWAYDMRKIPDLYGYLPQFKRVRQFPANQRFEPLVPGAVWFLSDPWAAGDPTNTWGNHKIVERKPMLGPWSSDSSTWNQTTWQPPMQKNPKFFNVPFELCPDVIVTSCEPTGYPRSPVSKRVAYVDARVSVATSNIRYDRQGKMWSNFEMAHGLWDKVGPQKKMYPGPDGKDPAWSWTYVHIYDFQTKRMSLCYHVSEAAGVKSRFQADADWAWNTYCTPQALQILGSS
ncbi:MAG: DUF1329 domain-containing protein [Nevskiaceae bacterium]|nr:MAG: DUF1329 domain-containing protein [Nevskiaceae bacterium]TBR71957.1 MAG: DUF1329 domain-containing protein [Nevskiaceae bacterium]